MKTDKTEDARKEAARRAVEALTAGGADEIVYVRELRASEMPKGMPEGRIFAIHDGEKGARLAMTDDRALAFRLARHHQKIPVSVH